MNEEPEPLRDFADRFFRDALRNPDNLREFLLAAAPTLAAGFDFSRMSLVEPKFKLPDWRRREADLLVEIPHRSGDTETVALVCVLIEHQTRPDPRMPLRTLVEVALYWERQWRAWEEGASPKEELRLTPMLPIVLHTGSRPWGSARTLAELLGPPNSFHPFAPAWAPVFWELSARTPSELLNAEHAFLNVLAVVRVEGEERDAFVQVFQQTMRKLDPIHGTNRVRWAELLQLIFGWVYHRRPAKERSDWIDLAAATKDNELSRQELSAMGSIWGKTMAEEDYEANSKKIIGMQARKRFGEPTSDEERQLLAVEDLKRLDRMALRVLDAESWADLVETQ